jgi:hypothetical protein
MANPNDNILDRGEALEEGVTMRLNKFPIGRVDVTTYDANFLSANQYEITPVPGEYSTNRNSALHKPIISGWTNLLQHEVIRRGLSEQRVEGWSVIEDWVWEDDFYYGHRYRPLGATFQWAKVPDRLPPGISGYRTARWFLDEAPATSEEVYEREFSTVARRVNEERIDVGGGELQYCNIYWDAPGHNSWRIYTFQDSGYTDLIDITVELKLEGEVVQGRLIDCPDIYTLPSVSYNTNRVTGQPAFAAGMYLCIGHSDYWDTHAGNIHEKVEPDLVWPEFPVDIYSCTSGYEPPP